MDSCWKIRSRKKLLFFTFVIVGVLLFGYIQTLSRSFEDQKMASDSKSTKDRNPTAHKEKEMVTKKTKVRTTKLNNPIEQPNCDKETDAIQNECEEKIDYQASMFSDAMGSMQLERQNTMQETCRKTEQGGEPDYAAYCNGSNFQYPTLYFSANYKVMFCEVAKVGCTQWKLTLLQMENVVPDPYALEHESIHASAYGRKTMLRNVKDIAEVKEKFDTYLKVMIVREPFERLLSAYNDKLAPRKDFFHPKYTPISKVIRKRYHPGNSTREHATFENFVDFLLDQDSVGAVFDLHWDLYTRACEPCTYKYDYIARLETIEKDSRYLEQLLGLNKDWGEETPIILFHGASDSASRARTSRDKMRKVYSNIPHDKRKKLYEMYRPDFEMFGYGYPHDILDV